MDSIFYYLVIYLVLGAVGMSIANRKAEVVVRKQRWVKYSFYVFITGIIITSIFLNFFSLISVLIILISLIELTMVNFQKGKNGSFPSFIVFALLALGFIFFAISFNKQTLIFIYFQVLVFDAFSQVTGQIFGKRPMVPSISPAKTIEGFIGGWIFCIISAILGAVWLDIPPGKAILFGVFTGITSFTGDILASWFKRLKKIKDYSNWLPGQGGFLDRFDSLIFTGAVYYLISPLVKDVFAGTP